jgi:hypothetical protein
MAFRKRVIAALDRVDASRLIYIDRNRLVHVCPACQAHDGWLTVRFHGHAERVDLECSLGCREKEIARALK